MPAIGAAAGLDVVVVAFVAAILAVALFPLLRPIITGGLSMVPFVGSWLARNVDGVIWGAYVTALGFVTQAVQPMADIVARAHWAFRLSATKLVFTTYAAWWAISRVHIYAIPAAITAAARETQRAAQYVIDYADHRFTATLAYVQALAQAGVRYTDLRIAAETAYIQQIAQFEIDYTDRAALALRMLLGREVALLEDYDLGLYRQGIRYTDDVAGQIIRWAQEGLGNVERHADWVGQQAEGYARMLHDLETGYAQALVGAAMTALLADLDVVQARVRDVEQSRCMRQCDPLGLLGEGITELGELLEAGILAGLVAEAVRDPRGVASALAEELAGPAREALGDLRQVVGV